MSAIALLLATAVAAPAASADADEIVITARKLQTVRMAMALSKKQGVFRAKSCAIKTSTGDAEIDPIPCEAAQQCSTLGLAAKADFVACVKTRGYDQIAALVARRRAARDALP